MKLLDRIAIERMIKIILNFIITLINIFIPTKDTQDIKKPRVPRWRLKKND